MTQTPAIRTSEVARAAAELARMKGSLKSWLEYRGRNDAVAAGRLAAKAPQLATAGRNMDVEQQLAEQLHTLLSEVMSGVRLPDPDVNANPNAAPQLAVIAIRGEAHQLEQAQTQGSVASMLLSWPVLIVAGLLLVITTAITSYADVAKEQERYACIRAGACTDYGFWLKAAVVVVGGWFVWEKAGVGDAVRRHVGGGKRR